VTGTAAGRQTGNRAGANLGGLRADDVLVDRAVMLVRWVVAVQVQRGVDDGANGEQDEDDLGVAWDGGSMP
jgi:hypothetical protein